MLKLQIKHNFLHELRDNIGGYFHIIQYYPQTQEYLMENEYRRRFVFTREFVSDCMEVVETDKTKWSYEPPKWGYK